MNPPESIFLYLPVPYWVAFVLLLYRHDLSRLFHPFKDDGNLRSWWSVLNRLDLLDNGRGGKRPERKVLPYVVVLALSATISLSWILKLFPPLWYYLLIVQGVSAIALTAAAIQYLGPPPRRPYVDVLRFPRLGSRIRHLPRVLPVKPANDENVPKPEERETPKVLMAKQYLAALIRGIKRRLGR